MLAFKSIRTLFRKRCIPDCHHMMLNRLVVIAITWSLQPVTLHRVVTHRLMERTATVNRLDSIVCAVWMRRHICLIQTDVCNWLLVVTAWSLDSRWLVCMTLQHLVVQLRGAWWRGQMVYVVLLYGDVSHRRLCILTVWRTQRHLRDLAASEQETWQYLFIYSL